MLQFGSVRPKMVAIAGLAGAENPMKIGPSLDTQGVAPSGRAGSAPAPAVQTVTPTDQVDISAASVQLQAGAASDYDAAKVDAIRQAITEGRFSVNAGAIADRLIADAAALLTPRS